MAQASKARSHHLAIALALLCSACGGGGGGSGAEGAGNAPPQPLFAEQTSAGGAVQETAPGEWIVADDHRDESQRPRVNTAAASFLAWFAGESHAEQLRVAVLAEGAWRITTFAIPVGSAVALQTDLLALDADNRGRAVLVWAEADLTSIDIHQRVQRWTLRKSGYTPAAGWSAAETVAVADRYVEQLRVSLPATGEPVVAWVRHEVEKDAQGRELSGVVTQSTVFSAVKRADGQWQQGVMARVAGWVPELKMAASDSAAYIAWLERLPAGAGVRIARMDVAGRTDAAVALGSATVGTVSGLGLDVNAAGQGTVVWRQPRCDDSAAEQPAAGATGPDMTAQQVCARFGSNGSWGNRVAIGIGSGPQARFQAAVSVAADGSTTVAWNEQLAARHRVWTATRPASAAWSAPTEVMTTETLDAPDVELMEVAGPAHLLAWVNNRPDNRIDSFISVARLGADGMPVASVDVPGSFLGSKPLLIGTADAPVVAWLQDTFSPSGKIQSRAARLGAL